jgi:hypothetical protein
MNLKEARKEYKTKLRELSGKRTFRAAFTGLLKSISRFAMVSAIVVMLFPVAILREIRNALAFVFFRIWRARRANQLFAGHGWQARAAFLSQVPGDYASFVKGGE